MAWESNTNATKVVAIKDGVERDFNFDGTMLLKDTIRRVSSQMGLGTVLVKADGRNVEPDEGMKAISEYQRIEVIPKNSGASDDETEAKDESGLTDEVAAAEDSDESYFGEDSYE
jgi:hypothetical protein